MRFNVSACFVEPTDDITDGMSDGGEEDCSSFTRPSTLFERRRDEQPQSELAGKSAGELLLYVFPET